MEIEEIELEIKEINYECIYYQLDYVVEIFILVSCTSLVRANQRHK